MSGRGDKQATLGPVPDPIGDYDIANKRYVDGAGPGPTPGNADMIWTGEVAAISNTRVNYAYSGLFVGGESTRGVTSIQFPGITQSFRTPSFGNLEIVDFGVAISLGSSTNPDIIVDTIFQLLEFSTTGSTGIQNARIIHQLDIPARSHYAHANLQTPIKLQYNVPFGWSWIMKNKGPTFSLGWGISDSNIQPWIRWRNFSPP